MIAATGEHARLRDTRDAFDAVAAVYGGPLGNNAVVQRMRQHMWCTLRTFFPPGASLLDLGCGTGIDAAYLAGHGYRVHAVDWSPAMVAETEARVRQLGLEGQVSTSVLGMQELDRLAGQTFNGIYSNLGAVNCAPRIDAVAAGCASLLPSGGRLVMSVIGRICPWEVGYYVFRLQPGRALVRAARGPVPVPLNGRTVWTSYYTPRELAHAFAPWFKVVSIQGLCILAPPPYLAGAWARFPRLAGLAASIDDRLGSLPLLRACGDHFLMVLERQDRDG